MKLKGGIPASQFNKLRLQKAAYFLNVFSNTGYFKFEEFLTSEQHQVYINQHTKEVKCFKYSIVYPYST